MIKKKTVQYAHDNIVLHRAMCTVDYETNARFMNLNNEYYMNIEYLYCI